MSQDLEALWKKHVDSVFLYRVVSKEYAPSILKNGLRHDKDPFFTKKAEIEQLFRLLLKLKDKGFLLMRWWGQPVDQEDVIKTTRKDLENPYIDFTSSIQEAREYYKPLSGGALVQTILIFTEEILMKRLPMTTREADVVKKLNKWAKKKSDYKNVILKVRGSCPAFETAKFQRHSGQEYIPSPFGSFEHFKKIIEEHGWSTYKPYLEGKLFHLRTTSPIPAEKIVRTR